MIDRAAIDRIAELAVAGVGQKVEGQDGREYLLVPDGYAVQIIAPADPLLTRIDQTVHFDDRASFIDYVNAFKTRETNVFVMLKHGCVTAFFDYHSIAEDRSTIPGRLAHQAVLTSLFSFQWKRWRNLIHTDIDFDEFMFILQDFLPFTDERDKVDQFLNSAAAIIGCEVNSLAPARMGTVRVNYREPGERGAAAMRCDFPHDLRFSMPVVADGPPQQFVTQLRYRLAGQSLLVQTQIFALPDIERIALGGVREQLLEELRIPIFIGNPVIDATPAPGEPTVSAPALAMESEAAAPPEFPGG